ATGEGSPLAHHGHHTNADPEINPPQHLAGNSLHANEQHDDNDSPAVTDGAHPVHGQADRSDSASPKFADDGDAHPGKVSHEPSALTALSNDVSGDDSAHGAHTAHGQADRSGDSPGPKFADVGGAHSAHETNEDTPVQSAPANNGHHWGADPEIN